MKKNLKFLNKYVEAPSPSGYEMELGGQKVWIDQVKPFCTKVETDEYGNAYAYYGYKSEDGRKTVLLDAHADEIGFFVFDITKEGFIKVRCLGGSDVTITPSSRVNIWTENGPVKGVFGHPAIHVHKREWKAEPEKMFIDIGVDSKEKVEELGIEVGTPITMVDGFMELGDYYCGRSLDDKIGGYINAQLLEKLTKDKIELPYNLVIVNAVQEEVGLHGAQIAAQRIKPDVAIAIDVCHDTDSPAYDKNKQGSISAGKGIVLMNAPPIHKKLLKLFVETAKKYKINYQMIASGRGTGTNADSYAYPNGIPTALLKMGMRYMHTTVETVHKEDVKNAIDLLYNVLQTEEIIGSFKFE